MICPSCSTENRPDIAFCEECGAPLRAASAAAPCGHANRAGIAFCEECGVSIETESPSEPEDAAEVEEPLGTAAISEPEDEVANCGHRNRPGLVFCEECGAALADSPSPPPTPLAAADPPTRTRRRWIAAAAAILLLGGGTVAGLTRLGSSGPPTAEELVARLPEPTAVTNCFDLGVTAASFIYAASEVAVEGPRLAFEVDRLGSGYAARMNDLGCRDEDIIAAVQRLPRPGQRAFPAEIVEYFLTGLNVTYPEAPVESVSTGGSP